MFHINHFIPFRPFHVLTLVVNIEMYLYAILEALDRPSVRPSVYLPNLSHPSNVNIQGNKKKNIINNFIAENKKKKCRRKGRKLKINSHFHYFPLLLLLPNVYVKWYNLLCCVCVSLCDWMRVFGVSEPKKKRKNITLCYVMTLAIWGIMLRNRLRLELELKRWN